AVVTVEVEPGELRVGDRTDLSVGQVMAVGTAETELTGTRPERRLTTVTVGHLVLEALARHFVDAVVRDLCGERIVERRILVEQVAAVDRSGLIPDQVTGVFTQRVDVPGLDGERDRDFYLA